MIEYKNIKEALEQLEKCKFIDEIEHPLENNTAFVYLKELSLKSFSELGEEQVSKAWKKLYIDQHVENWSNQYGLWDDVPTNTQQKYLGKV